MITKIIICRLLICLVFEQFAPLFGAYLQTFIGLIGGIFGQLFVAVLSIFNGLFGGLIRYTIELIIGADTTHNNDFIGNDTEAPQGACTIQINGFVGGLIALHVDGALTNFIGCDNGLSCPHGPTTAVTIVSGFLLCLNGYLGLTPGVGSTTPATVTIMEGIENIFECGFESPNVIFFATNNSEIVRFFGAPDGSFSSDIKKEFGDVVVLYFGAYHNFDFKT